MKTPLRCPVCGSGDVTVDTTPILNATCSACGWHFNGRRARRVPAPRASLVRLVAAVRDDGPIPYVIAECWISGCDDSAVAIADGGAGASLHIDGSGAPSFMIEHDGAHVDWSNIQPHPRLAELAARCHCGAAFGDHLTPAADPSQRAERWPCNGWKPEPADKAGAL